MDVNNNFTLTTHFIVYMLCSVITRAPENLNWLGTDQKWAAMCGLQDYKKTIYLWFSNLLSLLPWFLWIFFGLLDQFS